MTYKILFVDDENDILASLRRLFMEDWCEVFTASSGQEALELIKKEPVDLIVSDQRMPEMGGSEFLERSKEFLPDSIRMLLTGYADINAVIDSINKGGVSKYITKPWNNEDLKATIQDALELRRLRKENEGLLELTKKQNLELKDLNENLEEKVKVQTEDILQMLNKVEALNKDLDKSLMNTVKVLSNVIGMKKGPRALSFKKVSKLSMAIAKKMNLLTHEIKDIIIASLLYNIGIIGINDTILNKPFSNMTSGERIEYMKHPILGQAALVSIENMQDVGIIVKHHHERWDGEGYPDNLSGEEIPVGSRIIAVTSGFFEIMYGIIMPSKFTNNEARQFIIESSGQRYDPEIVKIFIDILALIEKEDEEKAEFKVSSSELKENMVLSKDIYTSKGLLLLHEGTNITGMHIKKIVNFEKAEGKRYEIYIASKSANP